MPSSHHNYHHFIKNKEMNEIYFSYAIYQFALAIIAVFVPIYLYKLDYSVISILFFYLLVSVYFVIFSYVGVRIVAKIGVKHAMLLAVPLNIAYFLGLKFIVSLPILFYVLPLFKALKMQLYNYGFHLNFVQHSDRKKEGRESAIVQSGALIARGAAPFIGGVILIFYSFPVLFAIGSILLAASMIPLFMSQETYEKIDFHKKDLFKSLLEVKNRGFVFNFAGYAIESWIGIILWPIFLFVVLSAPGSVGFVVSLSTILTLLLFYFIGKKADETDKEEMLRKGTVYYFFGWVGRLFAYNFTSVFLIDTYKNLSMRFIQIPWTAYFYEEAKKRNYFYFIVQRELVFHLARIAVVPVLMLIFYIGVAPYQISFSIAAMASLFYASSLRPPNLKKVNAKTLSQ